MLAAAVLAVAGQMVIFQAERTVDRAAGVTSGLLPSRVDFADLWHAGHALLMGASSFPWYGDGHRLGYPPLYSVLLSPMGALLFDVVIPLSVLLSAALAVAVVIDWSGLRPWGWPLLLSYPVFKPGAPGPVPGGPRHGSAELRHLGPAKGRSRF